MQFKKLLLLLIIGFTASAAYAQSQVEFPVSGKYKVYRESGSVPDDFNQISVENAFFSLLYDETSLETYRLVSSEDNKYDVEQYISAEDVHVIRDKKRFTVQIDNSTATELQLTIIHSEYSEKFRLVKTGL